MYLNYAKVLARSDVILRRYLFREVIMTIAITTLILVAILLSQQFVRYLNYVATGRIASQVFFQLLSYEIPYLLALLLPLGLYLGLLITYNRLYTTYELFVSHLYGFSRIKLFILTTYLAGGVGIIVLILMVWVNPWLATIRSQVITTSTSHYFMQNIAPGRFQTSADGKRVIYVENLSRDHQNAHNIFLAELQDSKTSPTSNHLLASNSWTRGNHVRTAQVNQATPDHAIPFINSPRIWSIIIAQAGTEQHHRQSLNDFFVVQNGYRYATNPLSLDYEVVHFDQYGLRLQSAKAHQTAAVEMLSLKILWQNYAIPRYAAELQWRFSIGLLTFILGWFALPLSKIRPKQTRYGTFILAIVIYVAYLNLLVMARHWLDHAAVSSMLGLWWVHGFALIFLSCLQLASMRQSNL